MVRPGKAVLIISALAVTGTASAREYKAGEVIVKYKDGVMRARTANNELYDRLGVKKVKRYSGTMAGFEQLILQDESKVASAIAELQKNRTVEYAQPNYIVHTMPVQTSVQGDLADTPLSAGVPCVFPGVPFPMGCENFAKPNEAEDSGSEQPLKKRPDLLDAPAEVLPYTKDPNLAQAWGLNKSGATRAWSIFKGSKDFIVADIDTGIDYNHEDLAFNLWRNPHPTDKKDIVGFDFIHNDGLPFDDNEHGTHTAGTIGAVGGNGVGISGVTQRVSLMALKFLDGNGSGTTSDAIRAIDYAISHGARVLSNSWGGKGDADNQALRDAIDRARLKDVLFIAAAGNDGTDNDSPDPDYPAAFDNDNLISVAATDSKDSLAYFSNYGRKSTHLAAPGVDIYSTVPGNKYAKLSGTSMACPHVAGAAALLWSRHPDWDYKRVKETLLSTVDHLQVLEDKVASAGRLNVYKALKSAE